VGTGGILIAAALSEELGVALELCSDKIRLVIPGSGAWKGMHGGREIFMLKTGMGPIRSEKRLGVLLDNHKPAKILMIGYGGALDPSLRVGDLVVGERASLFGEHHAAQANLADMRLAGTWDLDGSDELLEKGNGAGLSLKVGTILTLPHIIGTSEQKLSLHGRFQASVIDMESAALARASHLASVPFACVRAITDSVQDELLAPFTYDPAATPSSRALKVIAAGKWIRRYSHWKENAAIARGRLREFLTWYLGGGIEK
jgi:nucleoside phosphorylase